MRNRVLAAVIALFGGFLIADEFDLNVTKKEDKKDELKEGYFLEYGLYKDISQEINGTKYDNDYSFQVQWGVINKLWRFGSFVDAGYSTLAGEAQKGLKIYHYGLGLNFFITENFLLFSSYGEYVYYGFERSSDGKVITQTDKIRKRYNSYGLKVIQSSSSFGTEAISTSVFYNSAYKRVGFSAGIKY